MADKNTPLSTASGGFDIIGDIHGQYDALEALLGRLGYAKSGGVWRHSERKAVFVGDLIDRGPQQRKVMDTVRAMMENGSAYCILGNHEFNAISYFTKDKDGQPLRKLSTSHEDPHLGFLREVGDNSALHAEYIAWFKTLPLWIETEGLCVIHACRDEEAMNFLRENGLTADNCLTDGLVHKANQKGTQEFFAVELLCKGPEIPLPKGFTFKDKDGKIRDQIRTRWWDESAKTYRELALIADDTLPFIPDIALPQKAKAKHIAVPTIVGHYWLNSEAVPCPMSKNVVCVDYSAGKGGPLVAYRWNFGDTAFFVDRFEKTF